LFVITQDDPSLVHTTGNLVGINLDYSTQLTQGALHTVSCAPEPHVLT